MRVEIEGTGTLVVTAESGLETFALERWAAEYFDPSPVPHEKRKAKLLIVGQLQVDKRQSSSNCEVTK